MNAPELLRTMELVAYNLSCAEGHERKAAVFRREAMSLQGAIHAEFKGALEVEKARMGIGRKEKRMEVAP